MNYKFISKVFLTFILLGIVFSSVNIEDSIAALRQTNLPVLLFAFFLGLPGICISTIKWKILLNAHNIKEVRFTKLLSLYHVGIFFSNFLPTEIGGDFVRSYIIGKKFGKKTEAFAAVFMERLTGLIALICFVCLGFAINYSKANNAELKIPFFISIGAFCIFFITFCNYRLFSSVLKRISLLHQILNKIDLWYDAVIYYQKKPLVLLWAMVISFGFQFFTLVYVYLLLVALQIEFPFNVLMLIIPLITLLGVIPITINSLGLREGAFIYLFSLFGLSSSEAFVLSILYRINILIFGLVGGLLYALSDIKYKNNKLN